jgi:iturin family lipopeptide synthetase A
MAGSQSVERPLHVLALSARTRTGLYELARRYHRRLATFPQSNAAEVCFTANTNGGQFCYRLAVIGESTQQLAERLANSVEQAEPMVEVDASPRPRIGFVFTGQGAQYAGMGRQLYLTQPSFKAVVDRFADALRPVLNCDLTDVMFGTDAHSDRIHQTQYTQPAMFVLQYALAELWRSWGVEPAALLGHSVGEYAAACVAGVFAPEDGLWLIAQRAKLMQTHSQPGAMAAVATNAESIAPLLAEHPDVCLAAINGPKHIVISGPGEAIRTAIAGLRRAGFATQPLKVSHAFHSRLMEPMIPEFEQIASRVRMAEPRIPLVSNVTGKAWQPTGVPDSRYWARQIRETVQFATGVRTLHGLGCDLFVELGPHPTLCGMGARCLPELAGAWLPSLRQGESDWSVMLSTVARLYTRGVDIDWRGLDRDHPRRQVPVLNPVPC